MKNFGITLPSLTLCLSHAFIPTYVSEYNTLTKETVSKPQDSRYLMDEKDNSDYDNETRRKVYTFEDFNKRESLMDEYKGLVNSILAYLGVGWAVGSSFIQTYIIHQSRWYHSDCLIYYKTKSDYYVLPKSANGSTVTAALDFYKYGFMVNAAPGNRPGACAYMKEYEDGPYSYH